MTPGLVSVVVASYNHSEFLVERMESLLAQTYNKLEILIIDDSSTDNSVEVLKNFEDDPRVTLTLRDVNGGWVAVSNQGAELAKGEFILYANCDDSCESEMISELVKALQKNPTAGVAFSRSLMVDALGKVIGNDYDGREPSFKAHVVRNALISGQEMSRYLLHSCVMPNLSAVSCVGPTLWQSVGFPGPIEQTVIGIFSSASLNVVILFTFVHLLIIFANMRLLSEVRLNHVQLMKNFSGCCSVRYAA